MLRRVALGLLLIACGAALTVAVVPGGGLRDGAMVTVGVLVPASVLLSVRARRPAGATAWVLFGVGMFLLVIADGSRAALDSSWPALIYVVAYPMLTAALLAAANARRPQGDRDAFADSLVIAAALFVPMWPFAATALSSDAPRIEQVTHGSFVVLDVLLLVLLTRVLLGSRPRPAGALLFAGILAALLGDLGSALTLGSEAPFWIASLLALSYVCFGAAANVPSMERLLEPVPTTERPLNPARAALLGAAAISVPLAEYISRRFDHSIPASVVIPSLLVVSGLVSWRLVDLTLRASRAHDRVERDRTLLQRIIDTDVNLITVRDRHGRYVVANGAFARFTGTTTEALTSSPHALPLSDPDREVIESGEPRRDDEAVRDAQGADRWLEAVAAPLEMPDESIALLTIASDVTTRVNAEREARDNATTLATAQDVAGFGSFELALDTFQYTWSDALCRIHGVEPGFEPSLEEALIFVHPDDRPKVVGHHRAVARGSGNPTIEYRAVIDGDERIFMSSVRLEPGDRERAARLVGAIRDVTGMRRSEAEIRRSAGAERVIGEAARRFLGSDPRSETGLDATAEAVAGYLDGISVRIRHVTDGVATAIGAWPHDPLDLDDIRELPLDRLAPFMADHPVWITNLSDEVDPVVTAHLERVGATAGVVLPITHGNETQATLSVWWAGDPPSDIEERLRLLRPLGDVLAVALERSMVREALHASEERLRTAFEYTPVGMAILSAALGLRTLNPALASMLGRTEEECIGESLLALTVEEDRRREADLLVSVLEGSRGQWRVEKRLERPDGSWVWVLAEVSAVRNPDGKIADLIGQFTDISDRKALEAALEVEATHDALTGLPNRRLLLDRAQGALARSARRPTSVAVLFLDLDRFKLVNDTHGHAAGDELLIEIAQRIEDVMRDGDTVSRLGGDEFVVLCEEVIDEHEALAIAKRIMHAVEQVVELSGGQVFVGASIGISIAHGPQITAEDLVRNADLAVYRAKDRGRSRIEVYGAHMQAETEARLTTEVQLRAGITRHEIVGHFQPILDLATGSVAGFETLARWQHPHRGLVLPKSFIAIAEETGLIVPLGLEMIAQACRTLSQWRAEGICGPDVFVSVNLAARQLSEPSLIDSVSWLLNQSHLEPAALHLEITETAIMADVDHAVSVLEELRRLGVRLAVDDFGTGQSSLTYLRRLPIHAVKVDQSFVFDLGRDEGGATIVAAVVELAHALGFRVIAEGVEERAHLDALVQLGCDSAQGFLLAPPLSPEDAEEYLRSRESHDGTTGSAYP